MPFCGSAIFLSRVVNDRDQTITILANVKDHIATNIVCILKDLPDFKEIPPPRRLGNLAPSCNLFGSF